MRRYRAMLLLLSLAICSPLVAQESRSRYLPTEENLQAREQFRQAKLGIFIHWGLYSLFGQGEWYLNNANVHHEEYAKAATAFYPIRFDAHEWVQAFKEAGARYVCFTSRHHDGFSMFKSDQTHYNIVDATPFGRDVVKELAEACQEEGLPLHLYYSHLDWTREDYYPLGQTGHGTGRTRHGEWQCYEAFMKGQLTELLTRYGPIGAIWFDGMWDQPEGFPWKMEEQYALIHSLQPACLVGNNHHKPPLEGEDFQMFERDLPGENSAGFSSESEVSNLPLETCETMNRSWGYSVTDLHYKSTQELVRLLVKAAGKGANLLLNIGPLPNGELPQQALVRLKELGAWTREYGETIYGTEAGPIHTAEWGTTTAKGDKVYLHILADQMPARILVPMPKSWGKVRRAEQFIGGASVPFERIQEGVVLHTEGLEPAVDRVVVLTVK